MYGIFLSEFMNSDSFLNIMAYFYRCDISCDKYLLFNISQTFNTMNEKSRNFFKRALGVGVSILASVVLLQSCEQDLSLPDPDMGIKAIGFITTIDNGDETRVVTDASMNVAFEMRDEIGVFAVVRNGDGQAYPSSVAADNLMHNVKYIRQVDGSWLTEGSARFYIPQGATVDFYAYYPWVADADPASIGYNAAVKGADLMTARALGISEEGSSNVLLPFEHKLALVQIGVDGEDVLSTMSVEMRGVIHRGTLDLSTADSDDEFTPDEEKTNILIPNEAGFFCAYVPAQTIAAETGLFKLNAGGDDMIYTAKAEANLTAGGIKRYRITPTATIADPLALPNTYLIYPGSRFVFPVAKAFAAWESNALLHGAGNGEGNLTAELVWQDVDGIVSSVSLSGEGRDATITIETTLAAEGNALVALKVDGDVFWSWHIWITRYSPNEPANQMATNNGPQILMDRNLGATSSVYGEDGVIGYLYQWGRKDPIPSLGAWTELDRGESYDIVRDMWDIDGNPVVLAKQPASADETANLVSSIQNPFAFITTDTAPNDWFSPAFNRGNDRWIGRGNSKTIFDPCPKGWRVPVSGEGSSSPWLDMGTPPLWACGPIWPDGTYYAAEGRRSSGTGDLINHGHAIYYWSATPFIDPDNYVGQNGWAFGLELNTIDYLARAFFKASRGSAMSLRCAREQ